jgi:hypothetical protein
MFTVSIAALILRCTVPFILTCVMQIDLRLDYAFLNLGP